MKSMTNAYRFPLSRSAIRRLAVAAVLGGACLLAACAPRSGYINHLQPDIGPAPKPGKSSSGMYLDLIRQMQKQGSYYASLANIEAFRQRYGNPPALRQLQGDALRSTGQTDAARAVYQKLLDTDQAASAWHGLGLIAASEDRSDLAEHALSRAVQLDPVNPGYLGDLGFERLRTGQLVQAREPLAKAAELAPESVKAISNLVLWMLLNGEAARADDTMQQADLPQPAREQIMRLAAEIPARRHDVASSAKVAAPRTTDRRTAVPSGLPDSNQIIGVPDSMLERFGAASTPNEVNP
ncbi:hypothetical protein ASD55_01330 [Rhodanobacter sp. Root561]|nr:hypothetical protein ASD55_01330 [Rhodanobacter sp. Root561]